MDMGKTILVFAEAPKPETRANRNELCFAYSNFLPNFDGEVPRQVVWLKNIKRKPHDSIMKSCARY